MAYTDESEYKQYLKLWLRQIVEAWVKGASNGFKQVALETVESLSYYTSPIDQPIEQNQVMDGIKSNYVKPNELLSMVRNISSDDETELSVDKFSQTAEDFIQGILEATHPVPLYKKHYISVITKMEILRGTTELNEEVNSYSSQVGYTVLRYIFYNFI